MKVVDASHSYESAAEIGLVFLEKEDGWVVDNRTTNEEVLEVLIDRVTEDYLTLPCRERVRALYLLREALAVLRRLSARGASVNVEGTRNPHSPVDESLDVLLGGTISCEPDALHPTPKWKTPSDAKVEVGPIAAPRESPNAIVPATKKRTSVSARSAAPAHSGVHAPWVTM